MGRGSLPGPKRASAVPVENFTRADDSDWIPSDHGAEEPSELLSLTADSELIEMDTASPGENASGKPPQDIDAEQIVADDDHEDDEEIIDGLEDSFKEPDLFLFRHLLSDDALQGLGKKGWSPSLVALLGKTRVLHALAGGIVLAALIATIVVLAAMPSKKDESGAALVAANASPKPLSIRRPAVPEASPTTRAAAVPVSATDENAAPRQIPEAGKSCAAWSKYPEFPWREHLEAASGKVAANGPCGLFGASVAQIAAALEKLPKVGPCGFDFIKEGGLLELFPTGKTDRRSPNMELLFVADKLFEIRLNYRESVPLEIEAKDLSEVFGAKPAKSKDWAGRKIQTVADGDVVIELIEEEWYGRTLKTMVFASAAVRQSLEREKSQRASAEKEIANGDAALAKWDIEKALSHYVSASDYVPAFGYAYVKQGVALTRLERFDEVEKVARKALERSGEFRAHAEAFGLLAVVALFRGDVAKAIENFDSAAKTDIANGFFASSAEELKKGVYAVDRVARTAARMECRGDKGLKASEKGLLARGNFPSLEKYFEVLKAAKVNPSFAKAKKAFAKMECP